MWHEVAGFPKGCRRVSGGFLQVFLGFRRVSQGFPQGFLHFVRGFQSFCGFPWFLHGFLGYRRVSQVSCRFFNLRKVFQGFCGFPSVSCRFVWEVGRVFLFFPEILKPQASKSWRRRKIITVIAQCCAKSYIFAGTVSGAINGGNFATVLRGASTVIQISVANLDLNSTS